MGNRSIVELIVFVVYLIFMLSIGVWFFIKGKRSGDEGEKSYFLGGRKMGAWVAALSAGSSDMSAWLLLGLPTSIYLYGIGKVWIAVGLAIGYTLSWIVEASRLRRFSIVSNDSITVPQYLTNRFKSSSKALQVVCAVVFLIAYTVYAATSVKACGKLFDTVLGIDPNISMCVAAVIIVGYTFLGGFTAVCWTDFFQSLLILGAVFLVPIIALVSVDGSFIPLSVPAGTDAETAAKCVDNYWTAFGDPKAIIDGLGWGIGYFGMPHIIIRFMSLRSNRELKKSAGIGISWTFLVLIFAVAIGIIGRFTIGYDAEIGANEKVFIEMVRSLPAVISGLFLSSILAASMSTADSQLLAASSAFTSDVYQPLFRRGRASDKNLLWIGRIVVAVITVIALAIALIPGSGTIMGLVENAWGVFGAAFGPVILLSLYWKRFNYPGAIAGIASGAAVDIALVALKMAKVPLPAVLSVYEIVPAAVIGLVVSIVVTLVTKKPSDEVVKLYEDAVNYAE